MPLQTAERLALQHQRDLATIAGATTSVVASVAMGADPATISTWYFGVVDGLLARIQAGHAQARLSSTQFLAKHAAMNGVDLTPVPASLNMERARTSLRVTGPVAFQTAMRAGQDEEQAIRSMATQMAGSSQRLVMAGDRDTFEQTLNADKGVIGWRRRLAGKSCGFCAMLASRGSVYKTRKTATQAKDGLAFHDHCNCWAEPLYKHEDEPADVLLLERQWQRITAGKRGGGAARAWRQHWEENVSPVERQRLGMAAAKAAPSPIPGPPTPTPGVVVRSALDSRKTLGGLEQAWTAEARRITGRDLDVVIPAGTSLQTAKEYAEGVLRGMERFPDSALQRVRFGQMAGDHYAEAGGIDIEFNERWATIPNRPGLQQGIARDIEGWAQGVNGWGARGGGTTLAVALHEFGHIVDINDLGKRGATLGVIARHAAREGIGPDELVARDISVYATTHPKELVAEAFADVMLRGADASPVAREIFDLLEAEYFRAGGRITPSFGTFPAKAAPVALSKMTVADLRALAKERGVTLPPKALKADIVRALEEGPSASPVRLAGQAALDAAPASLEFVDGHWIAAGSRASGDALVRYSGAAFDVNRQMRLGKFEAGTKSIVRDIDRVMTRSRLSDDVIVWRGFPVEKQSPFGASWPKGDLTGREWTDAGFSSTTVSEDIAKTLFGREGVVLRVSVPRGTGGVRLSGLHGGTGRIGRGEGEVLLERDLRYRVVADRGVRDGVRMLDVEIVPVAKPPIVAATPNLSKLKVADLRTMAAERQIPIPAKATKAELVRLVQSTPDEIKALQQKAAHQIADVTFKQGLPGSVTSTRALTIVKPRAADLTETERRALDLYGGDLSYNLNRALREGDLASLTERRQLALDGLDSVMSHSGAPSDLTVYRIMGIGQTPFGNLLDTADDLVGRTWTDLGFISTSVDYRTPGYQALAMRIRAPRGTRAVSGFNLDSDEILLDRGLQFRVVADYGMSGAVRRIDVEVVPRVLTETEQKAAAQRALRAAARERNRLIESSTGTARLLAEVDELISKGASKATILQRLDPKLTAPDQVFAGADAEIVKALRAALETGDAAKLRTALTRAGTKAKVKPISKAGAKTKFDPATMESVGGEIADGAQVVVVTRGSTLTLPDGSTMQLTKAKVTAVAKPPANAAYVARQDKMLELARSGTITEHRELTGGGVADVTLITYDDGSRIVFKLPRVDAKRSSEAEELAGLVLDAVGMRAPAVRRSGGYAVSMEFMPGKTAAELGITDLESAAARRFIDSKDGRLLGLADAILGNSDRNTGNWMRLPGARLAAIDHGYAFTAGDISDLRSLSPFVDYLFPDDPLSRTLRQSLPVSRRQLARIRTRLEALRPDFARLARIDWYTGMIRRLADLEKRAALP